MTHITIAVREGYSIFAGGTLFRIDDVPIVKQEQGVSKKYFTLADDGMGRTGFVETKGVIVCSESDLQEAVPGHGSCMFTKSEIKCLDGSTFDGNFSVRTISIQSHENQWFLVWRGPAKNQPPEASFVNKLTNEVTTTPGSTRMQEYEVYSLNSVTYEETRRKHNAIHVFWSLASLPAGFYEAQVDLGNSCIGSVHLIKHFPIQLNAQDLRKTEDIEAVDFSETYWNSALSIELAWGPASRIPVQVRLLERHPELTWANANFLSQISREVASFAWRVYEKEIDGLLTTSQAMNEVATAYGWVNDENQRQLKSQGEYYAAFKR